MFSFLKKVSVNKKIAMMGAGGVLVTAVALVAVAVLLSGQYNSLAQSEVDVLIDADLNHIAQGVYHLAKTADEAIQKQIDYNLNVARHVLAETGEVVLAKKSVAWTVTNQFTNEGTKIRLPMMRVGNRGLGQNTDPAVESAVVDEVTRLVGETCTIFQRMNKQGDMLRVATTVQNAQGKRAIGSYIPVTNPDGTANPVIAAILKGGAFHGRAFVVDAWYLTAYEPIKDSKGNITGMLYVGIRQKTIESHVRQTILQTKVGRTGYVYALGAKGESRGHYIVSQRGERDGEDIWETRDSDGRAVIKEIIGKATALQPGALATERYRWQNPGEPEPRWKIARLAYYAPWNWVIGVSVYEDEINAYRSALTDGRLRMTSIMSIAGVAMMVLVGLCGTFIAWTISRPILQMKGAVETIIQGDLDQVVDVRSRDEIGALAQSFNIMTGRLKQTIEGLSESERKFRAIFDSAFQFIGLISLDGTLLEVNKTALIFCQIKESDVIGKPFWETPWWSHSAQLQETLRSAVQKAAKGEFVRFEATHPGADGTLHDFDFSLKPMTDDTGNVVMLIPEGRDVTERKRAEETLAEKQRLLEELNVSLEQRVVDAVSDLRKKDQILIQQGRQAAMGEMIGNIAHQWRQPLNTLGLIVQELQMTYGRDEFNKESLEASVKKAMGLISYMSQTIDGFSNYFKPDNEKRLFNVNQAIAKTLYLVEPSLKNLNINIETIVTGDTDINGYANEYSQVLFNILVNSRDAFEGSDIDRERVITINVFMENDKSVVTIADNAGGIPENVIDKVFDPYFTTKGPDKGTGIGLYMAKTIIEKNMGGRLTVRNRADGAEFRIEV